jgi:hypothetical protein
MERQYCGFFGDVFLSRLESKENRGAAATPQVTLLRSFV